MSLNVAEARGILDIENVLDDLQAAVDSFAPETPLLIGNHAARISNSGLLTLPSKAYSWEGLLRGSVCHVEDIKGQRLIVPTSRIELLGQRGCDVTKLTQGFDFGISVIEGKIRLPDFEPNPAVDLRIGGCGPALMIGPPALFEDPEELGDKFFDTFCGL